MPTPIYAIGDIHGQLAELHRVLDLIETDGGKNAQIVFLGDYTDRGPHSAQVLDLLIEGRDAGRNWHFIKGNHDRMFEWFMQDYPKHEAYLPIELDWLHPRLGGDTTLASYGIEMTPRSRMIQIHAEALKTIPEAHTNFLRSLPLTFETDTLFFAHAGIKPDVNLADQHEEDLLWIRKEFHIDTRPHPKLIVHGHTPVDTATHYGNRINLDSGAGYGKPLTAAVLEGRECWTLTDSGRAPLSPE